MILELNDRQYILRIDKSETVPSRHTRADLHRMDVRTRITHPEDKATLVTLLGKNGFLPIGEPGNIQQWKLLGSSYSFQNEREGYDFSLEILENESLDLKALVLNDLEVQPYYYEEKFEGEDLVIRAKVKADENLQKRLLLLQKNGDVVTVVRSGIDTRAITMRFGGGFWSRSPDGAKMEINLFEPTDAKTSSGMNFFAHQYAKAREFGVKNMTMMASLLELLEVKKVLTSEEAAGLREGWKEHSEEFLLEYSRVQDLDKFDQ